MHQASVDLRFRFELERVNVGDHPSCMEGPVIVRPLGYYLDDGMSDDEAFDRSSIYINGRTFSGWSGLSIHDDKRF